MRKSKEETAQTRERIVKAAAAEFREKGIVATGLAELMSAAGLTHGGFYRHFGSKDQLVAEASVAALTTSFEHLLSAAEKEGRGGLKGVIATYLSPQHRDHPGDGCPLAALGSELARADEETRQAATAGFLRIVELLAKQYDPNHPADPKQRAMVAASTLIGALTISRIVTDEALSAAILRAAEESLTVR